MKDTLVLVHTIPPLVSLFDDLCKQRLPSPQRLHVVDEPLLERVRQRGRLAAEDASHLLRIVRCAEQIGAGAILVTCSTISPCVDEIRSTVSIPIIKIDQAMIAEAVGSGSRIGVIATSPTTLEPTRKMLEMEAGRACRRIDTRLVLVEHAFEAFMRQDGETHDRLIREAVLALGDQVENIVFAQASMARALDILPENQRSVPILSSPLLALAQVKRHFDTEI